MAERYTGPSAGRIADLVPHRVTFDRGWFWTKTVCHGGESDGLAFRQRPDGNGIDVRCHTGSCGKGVIVTELEELIGLPIWTAYEPVVAAGQDGGKNPWWKRKPVVVGGVVTLLVAAPLLTLDPELFFLNLFGLGIGWLLLRRFMPRRPPIGRSRR